MIILFLHETRGGMTAIIEAIARERVTAHPSFGSLEERVVNEIVSAVTIRVQNVLLREGWNMSSFTATDAITADLAVLRSLDLLRSSKIIPGDVSIELERQRKRERQDILSEQPEEDKPVPNCSFSCSKCHKKTVFHWTVQTRSSDEPSTVFYVCLSCGNKSKGS